MENGKSRLTYKGPVQPSIMKVRRSSKRSSATARCSCGYLASSAFTCGSVREVREEFSHEDVIVAIDETPVGVFIEIEGTEHGITEMTLALGRTPADLPRGFVPVALLQHRDGCGLLGSDMMFPPWA